MKKRYIAIITVIVCIFLLVFQRSAIGTMTGTFMTDTNFNIWGDGVQSTYADRGYSTILVVGGSQTDILHGEGSVNGVTLTTRLNLISEGNYVQIEYTVKNISTQTQTIGVSTHADIQIGSNDYAPIQNLPGNRGFTMTDGTHIFSFIGRNSYAVTDVDTYWFGDFDIRTQHLWDQSYTYQYGTSSRQGDSGMTYSWKNRTIAPNETQVYSALIGIGELNTPPVLTNTTNLKNEYYPNNIISLSGTINDADVGDILKIKYALDGGRETVVSKTYTSTGIPQKYEINFPLPSNITEGKHKIQIWAVDDKGNMSIPITVEFNLIIDKTPPTATHTIRPETWTNATVTITVKATDTQTGVKQITTPNNKVQRKDTVTYTVTANGTYNFILEDHAGNKRTYPVTITNIDKTKPNVTTQIQPNSWTNTPVTILWNATDDLSGVESVILPDTTKVTTTNGTYTVTENGTYTFTVKDKAGNSNTHQVVVTNIDAIKPELQLEVEATEWTNTSVSILWNATDDLSGVASVTFPDTTKVTTTNGTYAVTENGTYTFIVEDNAGNTNTYQITIENIDTTPPQLTAKTNPDTWVIDTTYIEWNASDKESGIKEVILPDGTKQAQEAGTYQVWENGTYTFIARDNAGNTTIVNHIVNNIDTTPPVLNTIIEPVEWNDSKVCIHWEASDSQSGFRRIDMPDGSMDVSSIGDLIVEQIGIYTFIAYDNVGNQTLVSVDVSNIDSINPKLELAVDIQQWTNEDITLTWQADDFESGLREVIQPNGESSTEKTGTQVIGENGVYTYIAYDNVGNRTVKEINIQNIDKIAPILQITTSTREPSSGNIEVTWKTDDFESGLREIVLPDGSSLAQKEGTFTIQENGTYTIIAYDNAGNFTIYVLEINNIYKNMLQLEVIPIMHEDQTILHWKVTNTEQYQSIILPDGTTSTQTEGNFLVEKNGTYTFLAYDKMYNYIAKAVEIQNLQ